MKYKYILFHIFFLFHMAVFSLTSAEKNSLIEAKKSIQRIDKSIAITKNKMKEIGDISFLPDLYFVLADLHHEKSKYLFEVQRLKYPKKDIEDLDLSLSKKSKKLAIESYFRFTENYPKESRVDKALFNIATSYRELGLIEEMVQIFKRITKEFEKSSYWEESQLKLGDYFFEKKKNFTIAIEVYEKILNRPSNPYVPFAKYKIAWSYINLGDFDKALEIFENILQNEEVYSGDKTLSADLKSTNIRRDTLIAMVWPLTQLDDAKLNQRMQNKKSIVSYFENLCDDNVTLIQVLTKLGQRLLTQKRYKYSLPVFIRLSEIQNDLEARVQAINNLYESYKSGATEIDIKNIIPIIIKTAVLIKNSSGFPDKNRLVNFNNFEIYSRDFLTTINKVAIEKKDNQLLTEVALAYENYKAIFSNSKYLNAINFNLAEIYFIQKKYNLAGLQYEVLFRSTQDTKYLESALKSYGLSLETTESLSKLESQESRYGYRELGQVFVKKFPTNSLTSTIEFNIAKTYYDERKFDQALKSFKLYYSKYPGTEKSRVSANLILDIYNQKEDYKSLISFGQSITKSLSRSPASEDQDFRTDIDEIVKQAQFRTIEDKAGDPSNRDYAKKILNLGKKYKGSDVGDLALYEAFQLLKSKKDPQVFEAGQQLLNKNSDSKYAKDIIVDLGQIAIDSGDFAKAAEFFERFVETYPNDSLSKSLALNAAVLRENQGDYSKAINLYIKAGSDFSKIAEMMMLAKRWTDLSALAARQSNDSLEKNYYSGLSLVRLGRSKDALKNLNKVSKSNPSTALEKNQVAHALYLAATSSLQDFRDIQYGRGDDTQVTKIKAEKLQLLSATYNTVINYGQGKWVIGALYSLGQSYKEFSSFISKAPIPSGLSAEVQVAFKNAIKAQVSEAQSKSDQFFRSCIENAEKYQVFTLFVKGCRTSGDYVVDDAKDEISFKEPLNKITPEVSKLRAQLLDQPKQPLIIFKLAQVYLKNKDYGSARMAFKRYIEFVPNDSEALAYLGVIDMNNFDFASAKEQFSQSISQNSKSQIALLGLAGLYKKFGFNKSYSDLRKKINFSNSQYAGLHPWIGDAL